MHCCHYVHFIEVTNLGKGRAVGADQGRASSHRGVARNSAAASLLLVTQLPEREGQVLGARFGLLVSPCRAAVAALDIDAQHQRVVISLECTQFGHPFVVGS